MKLYEWTGALLRGGTMASLCMGGERVTLGAADAALRPGGFDAVKTVGGLEVKLEARTWPAEDAVEWVLWLRNTGDTDTPLLTDLRAADVSVCLDEGTEAAFAGINGDTCNQENFLPLRLDITDGFRRCVSPAAGRSSCPNFPYFDLQDSAGGVIIAIGWSGQWFYDLTRTGDRITFRAGLEDASFYLRPGEEVRLPRILMKGFAGDAVDGHNSFRRLMLEHYSPKKSDGSAFTLPAAAEDFGRYSFKFDHWNTQAGQLEYVDHAAKVQLLDTVWVDASWFRGGFPHGVGNTGFRAGLPNGLRPISDSTRAHGMKFLLWFEVERVCTDSDMERQHPEWLIRNEDRTPQNWLPNRKDSDAVCDKVHELLNLGIPEARQYVAEWLIDFIRREGVDIYRQDFNIDPLPFWRSHDEPGRKGLTEIRYIMGLYRLWDDLHEAFPDMLIDNCASGGRRIDLETCMRAVPLWRSDTGCRPATPERPSDLWNQNQSLGLSTYLPYHAICSWETNAYEFRSAATNGIACQFDLFDPGFDFDGAKKALAEHARLRGYWLKDFYPLTPAVPDSSAWAAWQFHDPDTGCGMVTAFRRAKSPDASCTFALRGVDPAAQYRLIISDEAYNVSEQVVSGEQLAEGWPVMLKRPQSSVTIEYRRV